jgi:hypothetical protein
MRNLFCQCSKLTKLPDISKWVVGNVIDIHFIFRGCSSLSYLPDISKWKLNDKIKTKMKINAIFEDSDISGVYAFNRNNRYNPYYRLKHCLGNSADVVFDKSDDHKVIFKIYSEKGE